MEQLTIAAAILQRLGHLGLSLATAESLTGGLLAATIVDVPGASLVYRGGLVVYATDLKHSLAGVSAALLAQRGPVDPDVAAELARGVRHACGADWGVATTGVAGPDPQGAVAVAVAVGTVFVAAAGPGLDQVRRLSLTGDRSAVRAQCVEAALVLLAELIGAG